MVGSIYPTHVSAHCVAPSCRNFYASVINIVILHTVPDLLPIKLGLLVTTEIFEWLIWLSTIFILIMLRTCIFVIYPVLWWFYLIAPLGYQGCTIPECSTRKYRRKYFDLSLRLRVFDSRLLLLGHFMICPTQSHILADRRTLSIAKFIHSTSHKVSSVFNPVWNHAYDSTNRFPPDGYILSTIFLVLSFMAMFISMYGAYKSILKSKKSSIWIIAPPP